LRAATQQWEAAFAPLFVNVPETLMAVIGALCAVSRTLSIALSAHLSSDKEITSCPLLPPIIARPLSTLFMGPIPEWDDQDFSQTRVPSGQKFRQWAARRTID
jgi:hypothetical protein